MTNSSENQHNKQLIRDYWRALAAPTADARSIFARYCSQDHRWRGFDPIGDLNGIDDLVDQFWAPLNRSFEDLERKTWIFFGGESSGRIDGEDDGKMWVTGTGVLSGRFTADYLGIPATHAEVAIRWGEFCRIEAGRIVETLFLLDMVDLIEQCGLTVLPPSRGMTGLYPPPSAGDGVMLDPQTPQASLYSLDHIRRFIFDGLNAYDESRLESMGMADYFHPDVQWYGPGGIGACLSFSEFQEFHQAPWLRAFPDRSVQDLDALIAEGSYSGAPGWNGVLATHQGDYLDHPASGRRIGVNGLDWWKRDGDRYIENWVFVDMLHLFRQLGVDLLERASMTHHTPGA